MSATKIIEHVAAAGNHILSLGAARRMPQPLPLECTPSVRPTYRVSVDREALSNAHRELELALQATKELLDQVDRIRGSLKILVTDLPAGTGPLQFAPNDLWSRVLSTLRWLFARTDNVDTSNLVRATPTDAKTATAALEHIRAIQGGDGLGKEIERSIIDFQKRIAIYPPETIAEIVAFQEGEFREFMDPWHRLVGNLIPKLHRRLIELRIPQHQLSEIAAQEMSEVCPTT